MKITNNLEQLNNLSETERREVLKILEQMSESGSSNIYEKLKYADYKEVPVDIETFITSNQYLGKAWKLADGTLKIYPYWVERLKELFPDNLSTNMNNAIFSGARGLGKSEIAVTCLLYLMHRVMCLRHPHDFFNLKPTEKICFAFMNITKTLAEEIGISKFQATVQMSPWFMERGTMSGRDTLMWNPPDYINIIVGSQASHVIGQPIFACLDGDTLICTEDGDFRIEDLVDETIKVYSVSDNGSIILSDECIVKLTKETTEEYEIELENGFIIRCTPEHRFMLIDGSYKEAQYLTEEDELAEFNYEDIIQVASV